MKIIIHFMWFEDNDQYVRAPTPEGFNRLVQQLEDNDSVLFESISLPSSKSASKSTETIPPETSQEPVVPKLNIDLDMDDFTDDDDPVMTIDKDERDPHVLQDELAELEMESSRKDEIIKQKDEQIRMLQKELDDLLRRKESKPDRPATANYETAEFYKEKYNKVMKAFNSLKDSLNADGKIRTVSARSARVINKPKFV